MCLLLTVLFLKKVKKVTEKDISALFICASVWGGE